MDRLRDAKTDTEAGAAAEADRRSAEATRDATAPRQGAAAQNPTGIDDPANLNAYQGKRGAAERASRATDEPYEAERHNQPGGGR